MKSAQDTAPKPPLKEGGGTFIPGAVSIPDLFAQLQMLWRHRLLMLLCMVLIPTAVYLWSASKPTLYQSSALIQVQAQQVDTSLFATPAQTSEEALNAAARLTKTGAVARVAAGFLRPRPTNPGALLPQITTKPDLDSKFITITATDTDPARAAAVANAFAEAVRTTRAAKARKQIDPAVQGLQTDLAQLDPNDPSDRVQRLQLSQQLQRLRAIRAAQGNNAQVVEPAGVSAKPVSPHPVRNALLALVLSVFVGVALVFVVDGLDRRIRNVDELEDISGVPLLGIVPLPNTEGYKRLEAVEAFRMLRASLTYFNIDRQLNMVVVSSPLKGDGKTTVATNLAKAIARTGKDVIVLDADLHQSQVASRFEKSSEAGLASVLVGESTLEDELLDVELEDARVRILSGGPRPPNPSELLASQEMKELLSRLSSMTDLVIVDTPPTLQVSDAIPLFERASGVVMIARLGKTTRDAMRRMVSVIETSGGTPLGVVATGSKASGLYGYGAYGGYGWGYGYKHYGDASSAVVPAPSGNGAKRA
jgi:capsular exopolysaccharide synthesis family protein